VLVVSGIKNIQQAYVARNMLFKRFFFSTLGGTIVAAFVGISMAYKGYGVWALVFQNLINLAIDTGILWVTVRWRPIKAFSFKRLRALFSFGSKLLAVSIINNTYNEVRQLIIGKMYSAEELAFYNKGQEFPRLFITNINTSIDSVLLPSLSREQDNPVVVKQMTRRAIKVSSYILSPLMIGLAVTSSAVVELILTNKWAACVPFMQVFCIAYIFEPMHTANLNAIKALGRGDLFLKLDIIKIGVGAVVLLIAMWFGPMVIAYSFLFASVFSQIINSWPNKKLLGYSFIDQLKDIAPGIVLSLIMGVCVLLLGHVLSLPSIITLLIQVLFGAIFYISGSIIFKMESFYYVRNTAKVFFNKRKQAKEGAKK